MSAVADENVAHGDTLPQHDNKAYTVGWICALHTEYVAARAFLDEQHQRTTPSAEHDNNHYTLGKMKKHNVVIAVCGEYGLVAAAEVARDLLHSFPNVRVGLMVGIGGGAPSSKNDIRLGDVVVSLPGNGNGGVMQYDYGKTIQGQDFKMTGSLNRPPGVLMTALCGLRARYECDGHYIAEGIKAILAKKPKLRKKFSQPEPSLDRLYNSITPHPPDCEDSCTEVCGRDGSHVPRPARTEEDDSPMIHYGLIASANQLMKDALLRDKLSKDKGVMCFEMEAAGLMNHFPCLVIRGICDYSDTHKNKAWQGYAAMTAAAFAKDLLSEVHPAMVEAERKISDILSEVEKEVRETRHTVEHMASNSKRDQNSGDWLVQSEEFSKWKTKSKSFLWLNGIPGCGKTFLTSAVIQDLEQSDQVLLYFYFDFRDESKQSLDKMIRSLISQCSCKYPETREILDSLLKSCNDGKSQPSFNSLCKTLAQMMDKFEAVTIVIDALDECHKRNNHKSEDLLGWIQDVQNSSICTHLLVTSRPEQDIHSTITEWASNEEIIPLQTARVEGDIREYVKARVREGKGLSRWKERPDVQAEIESTLIQKADGMFRWVACQLDDLENCFDLPSLRRALHDLPQTLDETYSRIIRNIPSGYLNHTKRILQFLTFSERPLTVEELVDAIAVDFTDRPRFKTENRMPVPDEIKRLASGLVVEGSLMTERYNHFTRDVRLVSVKTMQLAHFSVEEWLLSDRVETTIAYELQEINARATIAMVCLGYITELEAFMKDYDEIIITPVWREININRFDRSHPLLRYARENWAVHARAVEGRADAVRVLARELFLSPKAFKASLPLQDPVFFGSPGASRMLRNLASQIFPSLDKVHEEPSDQLAWTSQQGLGYLAQDLIEQGAKVNCQDSIGATALHYAARAGHEHVVDILIRHGADLRVICREDKFGTPLDAASFMGHESTVRLLLQFKADVKSTSFGGKESIVEHGADVNTDATYYEDALVAAAEAGHEKIVALLLDAGADVIAGGKWLSNAFAAALRGGHQRIFLLLLEKGAELDLQQLFRVARCGWDKVVSILLHKGADANSLGKHGELPLFAAVEQEHLDTVLVLLKAGADPKMCDRGTTVSVFQHAVRYSWSMEILLTLAAENKVHGRAIVALLMEKSEGLAHITEAVIEAAARNSDSPVLTFLLKQGQPGLTITENILRTAAANPCVDSETMALLLGNYSFDLDITNIVQAAASNSVHGVELIKFLVRNHGTGLILTHDIIMAAVTNPRYGADILAIFQKIGRIHISEPIVEAAVLIFHHSSRYSSDWDIGKFDWPVVVFLLKNYGQDISITGNVLRAAVKNEKEVEALLHLLIQERGEEIRLTKDVIRAAGRNEYLGKEVMNILLEHKGRDTTFTEDMVASMVFLFDVPLLKLMFEKAAHDIPITVAIVKAAMQNMNYNAQVMALILDLSGDSNEVAEAVIESCMHEDPELSGLRIMYVLWDKKPDAMRECITINTYLMAVSLGRKEIIGFLCQHFLRRHTCTEWIAIIDLHKASHNGDTQRVQRLLQSGCPPDSPGWCGETPLFSAAFRGHVDIVRLLLRENVEVNVQVHNGKTALFKPAWSGNDTIVELLLAAGCRADIRDTNGKTALDWAKRCEYRRVRSGLGRRKKFK
ncbi:hypothetical protein S40288_09511, partial [Stachybotrys chartarum IBT 40288]